MGSSTKKKNEKKKDFQKTKLKVGKARPTNTNATSTSFTAKSIAVRQQNLSETGRDAVGLFNHNLSLLSSKSDAQRKDALAYLTSVCAVQDDLPQTPTAIVARAQPLILDGSLSVRQQLLKLLRSLSGADLGPVDQLLLYTRAGMTHLSNDIRKSALDVMDWLLQSHGLAVLSCPGGWVKTLRTFQNLLAWQGSGSSAINGNWSASKPATSLGSNKLLVHQLTTLSHLLTLGLTTPSVDPMASRRRAAISFPIWHVDAHALPKKTNCFGYLNLFGAPRDAEGEVYDDADERVNVFVELGLREAFGEGVKEAKKEAGEVGRAAAGVEKALRLAETG